VREQGEAGEIEKEATEEDAERNRLTFEIACINNFRSEETISS